MTLGAASTSTTTNKNFFFATTGGITLTVPKGNFSTLLMLGAMVDNITSNTVTITVTYLDGSTQSYTQQMSDWCGPRSYTNESIAQATTSRSNSTGSTQTIACNLYGYSIPLTNNLTSAFNKAIQSISLSNSTSMLNFVGMAFLPA